ncbi:glutamate racemase [Spirochaeta cellobiosiphila]|uniref:glutamate racemase n=1 Tax=Spirochaeta cellobiosiphila TaxID=504483 RepID=UPI000408E7EF|nr:glutamate racemase [Spirochaeta cellobiosiphila]
MYYLDKMLNQPVVIIDSGVGGLPYLKDIRKSLPLENYIYVADTAHFPYGDKSEEELNQVVLDLVTHVTQKWNPKLLLVACNTASVSSLKVLRDHFSYPIVGVVPAVKPAAKQSKNRIGVLATKATVKASYVDRLIVDFASDKEVIKVGAGDIVKAVEQRYLNEVKVLENVVYESLRPFTNSGIDTLVLGCTHFLHVKDLISDSLGSSVKVIDSCEGVTKQVHCVLNKERKLNNKKTDKDFFITTSSVDHNQYDGFLKEFQLTWGEALC